MGEEGAKVVVMVVKGGIKGFMGSGDAGKEGALRRRRIWHHRKGLKKKDPKQDGPEKKKSQTPRQERGRGRNCTF